MEVSGYYGQKFLCGVVENPVVQQGKEHDEIGLRGFGLNFFDDDDQGVVKEVLIEYTYLLMLIHIWPVYWKNQLESINVKVYQENGKYFGIEKGRIRRVWRFSRN